MQAQSAPAMEFFQSLLKGSGMSSSFANWMAPTLDPDELERKIVDLRVVLQWLEANVRLTQATIQGLEVQRMTLSTLKTMNVDFGELASHLGSAMRAGAQAMGAAAQMAEAEPAAADRAPGPGAEAAPEPAKPASATGKDAGEAEPAPLGGIIDPMQWWSTLSEQFTKVASEALRDSAWPMPGAATAPAGASSKPSAGASSSASPGASSRAAPGAQAAPGKAAPARKRPAATAKAGAKAGAARRKAPARPPR